MSEESESVAIWRASAAEIDTAFGLVGEYYEAASVVARESREEFANEYFGERAGIWLAGVDGELAGCIGLRKITPLDASDAENGLCAEIKRMYVRQKFRGHGIAARLLRAAEDFARQEGYARIYLDTASEMVAAARLYERNGYERCARYNENPQAAIFMRKAIGKA